MEQSKQPRNGYMAIIALLTIALILVLYFDHCNLGHHPILNPQGNGNDSTKPGGLKPDTMLLATSLLSGTVLEISNSNPATETTEANDQLAYIYNNTTPISGLTGPTG